MSIYEELANKNKNRAKEEKITLKNDSLKICLASNQYFYLNKWRRMQGMESAIKTVIKENLNEEKIDKINVKLATAMPHKKKKSRISVEVIIKDKKHKLPILIEYVNSNQYKKHISYFEGTLQLRRPSKQILSFISNFLIKEQVVVAEKQKLDTGMDIKVSNQKKLLVLGVKLQKRFGGKLKTSKKLFSKNKQTSKEIYRVNVFYQAPLYKKGDVIVYDENIFLVESLGKKVKVKNLMTSKIKLIENKDYVILKKTNTKIITNHPEILIIHPNTFQLSKLKNTEKNSFKIGEKIRICEYKNQIYIV